MNKWHIVLTGGIVSILGCIAYILFLIPRCMKLDYPVPMMGTDVKNWVDMWLIDTFFAGFIIFPIMLIAIILIIISTIRLKKEEQK